MLEQLGVNTLIYLILAIVVISLTTVLLWLALRPARLWYWKKREEVEILKSIEEKISDFENRLGEKREELIVSTENRKEDKEEIQTQQEVQEMQEAQDDSLEVLCEANGEQSDVVYSKKGTAFSEKELYDIIKF